MGYVLQWINGTQKNAAAVVEVAILGGGGRVYVHWKQSDEMNVTYVCCKMTQLACVCVSHISVCPAGGAENLNILVTQTMF